MISPHTTSALIFTLHGSDALGVEQGYVAPPATQSTFRNGVADSTSNQNRFFDAFIASLFERMIPRPRDVTCNTSANRIIVITSVLA